MDLALREPSSKSCEELFVIFQLGTEEYAVSVNQVREVIKPPEIVRIPEAEDFIEGMINIRGRIIPVASLNKRLFAEAGEISAKSRVLIVDLSNYTIGLVVDHVSEVVRVDLKSVQKAPEHLNVKHNQYIQGILDTGNRMVILLDINGIFA